MFKKYIIVMTIILAINCQPRNSISFKHYVSRYKETWRLNRNVESSEGLKLDASYDFIIVGSGSAGSVIANRLSEVPEWNILLVEAGEKNGYLNQIPILAPIYQIVGDYNWNYTMEKQNGFCLAMEEQLCAWPRGKALGGTTILNYMIYTRGHPLDYDQWGEGWSYQEVLPYFLKSEECNLDADTCETAYHSTNGLLSIEEPYSSKLTEYFITAGRELGYNEVDYNSNNIAGFSKMQATQKFGRRHSVAAAFLLEARQRKNLKVLERAVVTKVLVNEVSKTTEGIELVLDNSEPFIIKSNKEVVLSAGVLNSPKLLMHSGIGPRRHLSSLGIQVIEDLPVGQQLYDHIAFLGMIFLINKPIEPPSKFYEPLSGINWAFRGKGFWTSLGGIESIAYISTTNDSYPDIELLLNGIGSLQFDKGIISRTELRITREFYRDYFKPLERKNVFSIMPVLLRPKSIGYMTLRSRDSDDSPRYYGNYLTDLEQQDLLALIKSIRFIQKLVQSEGFRQLDTRLYEKTVPGCGSFIFDSDYYWECAIRHLAVTLHHQIGTCKMGHGIDSVVDHMLRVKGIEGLRVADTSVIPITSAHTSAPAIMIGEKLAAIIKNEYKAPY